VLKDRDDWSFRTEFKFGWKDSAQIAENREVGKTTLHVVRSTTGFIYRSMPDKSNRLVAFPYHQAVKGVHLREARQKPRHYWI